MSDPHNMITQEERKELERLALDDIVDKDRASDILKAVDEGVLPPPASIEWFIETFRAASEQEPIFTTVVGDYKVKELLELGRIIWGSHRYELDEILVRLQVGVGDLARCTRDGEPKTRSWYSKGTLQVDTEARDKWVREVKKELGNIIFSTIRWCDDLGFDVTVCLALAIEAQRKFAASGKPR